MDEREVPYWILNTVARKGESLAGRNHIFEYVAASTFAARDELKERAKYRVDFHGHPSNGQGRIRLGSSRRIPTVRATRQADSLWIILEVGPDRDAPLREVKRLHVAFKTESEEQMWTDVDKCAEEILDFAALFLASQS